MIANFALTYRCSSRCKTCSIWKIKEQDELSLEEIERLFSSNLAFLSNVSYVQLTGGEPFQRSDLVEVVSIIHKYLPKCTFWIPTNALNPEAVLSETKEMLRVLGGGLGISVSVDGIGRTHDEMRGVKGSFDRAVETLQGLFTLRKTYPYLGLTMGMTLTPENYREIWDVYGLAESYNADFSFRPVNFSGIYYRNSGDFDLKRSCEELDTLIRRIGYRIAKRKGIIKTATTLRYMSGALEYIREPTRRLPCSAGSRSFFLDPYGDVYPCIIMNLKMGNVKEESLDAIWNSERAWNARNIIGGGSCKGCWLECEKFREIKRDLPGLALTVAGSLIDQLIHGA